MKPLPTALDKETIRSADIIVVRSGSVWQFFRSDRRTAGNDAPVTPGGEFLARDRPVLESGNAPSLRLVQLQAITKFAGTGSMEWPGDL